MLETQIIVLQSSEEKTDMHIYGADSIDELGQTITRAFKIENIMVYYHKDGRFIDALAKVMKGV